MSTPLGPESFEQKLKELERRLFDLETSQRAAFTSIIDEDGKLLARLDREGIKVYDAAGVLRARLGYISASAGYGVSVYDGNGGLRFEVNDAGYRDPWLPHPMIAAGANSIVTSGSFAPIYQGQAELTTHEGVSIHAIIVTAAATTAEVRLKNNAEGTYTDVVTVPAGTQQTVTFQWLHGTPLGQGPVRFDLEVRRASGAGNVTVYQPYLFAMADPLQCSAGGL